MHFMTDARGVLRFVARTETMTGEHLGSLLTRAGYTQADFARIVRVNTGLKTSMVHVNGMIKGRLNIAETARAVAEAVEEVLNAGGALPPSLRGPDHPEGMSRTPDLSAALKSRTIRAMTPKEFQKRFEETGLTRDEFATFASRLSGKTIPQGVVANAASGKTAPWPEMIDALKHIKKTKVKTVHRESMGQKVVVSKPLHISSVSTGDKLIDRIIAMRMKALSLRDIGDKIGVSYGQVRNLLHESGHAELTGRVRRQVVIPATA